MSHALYQMRKIVVERSKEDAVDTAKAMLIWHGLRTYEQVNVKSEKHSLEQLDVDDEVGSWCIVHLGRCPSPPSSDRTFDEFQVWEVTFLLLKLLG